MGQRLTSDKIFEKEFSVDFKGYSAIEVDSFLDQVLSDYEFFENTLSQQLDLLRRYEKTVTDLKKRINELENEVEINDNIETSPTTQLDLLRRVSKLEEIVYNKR